MPDLGAARPRRRATRSPRRCRGCRRPTAARSPTRSSTSPTHEQRVWLRKAIESWRYRTPLTLEEQRRLYTRLCEVEGMERYLRRSFLGQKQFSLEGLDVLIPMLDESLELACRRGHRARSCSAWRTAAGSTCSPTRSGCRTSRSCASSRASATIEVVAADAEGGTGDVKYHLGAEGVRDTAARRDRRHRSRRTRATSRRSNPVVEGMDARRADRPHLAATGSHDPTRRDADPAPRRRGLRRPGRRRRDAQPLRARGLLDRRHAAHDHEQPGRLHDRPGAGPLDALLLRPRQGLRHADRPRERRRSRGGDLGRAARARLPRAASATTSSSTSSATAASATTSRTRPPTRSR